MLDPAIQLVRHATLRIAFGNSIVLVDPVFAAAGAIPPVPGSDNERRNPLVPVRLALEDVLEDVGFILVTHTHRDHWDEPANAAMPTTAPVLCQPADEPRIRAAGFSRASAIDRSSTLDNITVTRTNGEHGAGQIGLEMGPVSGFVLSSKGQPTIYIAGDTVWSGSVQEAITIHKPDVIVVNAGAAQLKAGGPLTMTAADLAAVVRAAPAARVMAVHMEAWNDCPLTRNRLRKALEEAYLEDRVVIPDDAEQIEL